jgi:PAS domain S-box-containing protein
MAISKENNSNVVNLDLKDLHPRLRSRVEAWLTKHPSLDKSVLSLLSEINGDYLQTNSLVPVNRLFTAQEEIRFEGPLNMVPGSLTSDVFNNYKRLIEEAGMMAVADSSGRIRFANRNFCASTGYSESELSGQSPRIFKSNVNSDAFYSGLLSTISSGNIWKGVVCIKKANDQLFWMDASIIPFKNGEKIEEYFAVGFDVTEKINANATIDEQRAFYEKILASIPVDIAVFDTQHRYLYVNPNAVRNPTVREFLLGKTDIEYCEAFDRPIERARHRQEIFKSVCDSGKMHEFIEQIEIKDGTTEFHSRCFVPVLGSDQQLKYVIGFGTNVTEKYLQDDRLRTSLEEKEALLGEVHHRVKNNLALVMGLLELQSTRTNDLKMRAEFIEMQTRISAMSRIHELLYRSQEFGKIELAGYTRELVQYLSHFYDKNKSIRLDFDLQNINLASARAVPLALLTNELVTNSYKYAFREGGCLHFRLAKIPDNRVVFEIRDSGPGLPEDFQRGKLKSLGFKLIEIFVRQIKGTCKMHNDGGLVVIIEFPYE